MHSKNQKNDDNVVAVREISDTYQISENFLAKIMQHLCRKNFLASKQGIQGGYYLNTDLSQLTFLDLVESLEGEFNVVNCFNHDENCQYHSGCTIIDPMRQLNEKFKKFYRSVKVNELIEIPFMKSKPVTTY